MADEVFEMAGTSHPILFELTPGFNPSVKHMCMTMEQIPVIHRPLFLYVLVNLMEGAVNFFFLTVCGFQSLQ
eukprot:CAMPEP_0181329894 /NCGR_PEP_ID=MMETSP1101-20121128/23577_1 /TAXON_ID=46948 /ORGANISM="Rhodomonas abbreviata, Strain Caron Lab Isolate" /LENGTH=71 /DNA_ID=CAMNT_0023439049 /DNA_START=21 /DNA_END=233 /DNA_ORIENTATION=-